MSSNEQIEANRQNGLASKGPTSEQGKAISARNSLKYGFSATGTLLATESAEEYARFRSELTSELDPQGALESLLVERIIGFAWRLRRFDNIEAGILAWRYHGQRAIDVLVSKSSYETPGRKPEKVKRYQQPSVEHEKHLEAQRSDIATYGDAFTRDTTAFEKLSRYENSIVRNLLRMLHELERRQAARQGKDVATPIAVDVEVFGADQAL